MDTARRKVLFLCTGNSARSQLAEALLRLHGAGSFEAFSAGTEPRPIHPLTLRVLEEKGISTEGLRSKNLREFLGHELFSHIIVVCSHAAESCPRVWPGVHEITPLFFDDPAAITETEEAQLAAFRAVRDRIEAALLAWMQSQQVQGSG